MFAPYITQPPQIDAYLDEWTSSQYAIAHNVFQPENWSGAADCSGRFFIAWDWDYLYLGIEVFDDRHVQEESGRMFYKGDDIEIQLDTDLPGDYSDGGLSSDDAQIGFTVHDFAGRYEAFVWRPAEKSISLEMVARQTSSGYVLEVAVPWSALSLSPEVETPYGFCLNVSDDDTPGTKGQDSMVSNVVTRKWGDPTTWGTLILVNW